MLYLAQGLHCTVKYGKLPKIFPVRENAGSFVYVIVKNHVNCHRENLWSDRGEKWKTQGISKHNLSGNPVVAALFALFCVLKQPLQYRLQSMSCFAVPAAAFDYTTGIMYVYTAFTITRACAKSPKK